jgi:hypothetical protein
MLDLIMNLLAAFDVAALSDLAKAGWRLAGDSQVGELLARPRAYRLTDVLTEVAPEAGWRVPAAGWRVPG